MVCSEGVWKWNWLSGRKTPAYGPVAGVKPSVNALAVNMLVPVVTVSMLATSR
jgi:hypothetical protein